MRKPKVSYRCGFLDVRIDFTPQTYGKLETVGPAFFLPIGNQGRKVDFQVVRCSCSGEHLVKRVDDMKSGKITSCGCARVVHGYHNTQGTAYKPWEALLSRCRNPNNRQYHNYGGRGIKVCDRWQEPNGQGFMNFLEDMGDRPSPAHSIDRIDVNGHYEPGNCRWVLFDVQCRNKRCNKWVTYKGETKIISDWAKELGINGGTLYERIYYKGMSPEEAFAMPIQKGKNKGTELRVPLE